MATPPVATPRTLTATTAPAAPPSTARALSPPAVVAPGYRDAMAPAASHRNLSGMSAGAPSRAGNPTWTTPYPRGLAHPTPEVPHALAKPDPMAAAGNNPSASLIPNSYTLGDGIERTLPKRQGPMTAALGSVPAAVTPAVPNKPATTARPGHNFNLQPGDANTFTFSRDGSSLRAGQTVAVPGLLNRPVAGQPDAPQAITRPEVTADTVARYRNLSGVQGAVIADPGKPSVADQIAALGGDSRLKGSRTLRDAAAQAILQQAGYANGNEQAAQQRQFQGDMAVQELNARAEESAAQRRLSAQQINANLWDSDQTRADRRLEVQAGRPTVTQDDGTTGQIGADGSWTPITNRYTGEAIKVAQPPNATGGLTAANVLDAYTQQRKAILGSDAFGPQAQTMLDALDASPLGQRYQTMMGGTATGAGPSVEQFLADAKAKGTKLTEQQLRAYYADNYGD
ncbi:MAG: hypothetical protein QM599_03425 [Pseudoxanthomonas sp.]